jgi:hypothetical protein
MLQYKVSYCKAYIVLWNLKWIISELVYVYIYIYIEREKEERGDVTV